MLIRTQSREALAEVAHIYIADMVGEKSYYIFGICTVKGTFSGSRLTLGIYPSKQAAMEELDNITDFFTEKPNGVYYMN